MIYIILLLISFLLTYFIKNYMIKKSLIATVNERSSHSVPTPHGGGIAISITWFIGLFYLFFTNQIEQNFFYALLCGIVISIVSFFDDIYELSPKLRLIIQAIVAIGGLYFLGGFETLTFGIFDIQNSIFTNIFAFFMIIWFINLYNFLDGINGYAGSEAIFLAFAGFIFFTGNHFLVLAVAVLGFLYWNWNKAKIFMGDVGSTLLGYNVAIFTIYYANQEPTNFWIWIILFSVYWFDATLTLIRRKLNKEKLSQAHKKHAYQRLTQARWSHYKVTNYSIVLNILLFTIVYFISNIFVAFLFSFVVLVLVIKFIDSKKAFE
ncbi:MraY family glycosyltransferase [Aliarcobacter butzleri]|uniref:MraY family glycosyltransferase n=1 Tax=Aliarcobacter butzleri TaxID=28197 RepID=UPI00263C5CED|nr:glycosyltransferase family 4 protein [Aliarcobacter butzleri]MDN5080209.1 glycosyltransferase family 4 protein [Aliarcobacter butzleri]MDN5081936.1 glycosyltransferase family 4 protein [Aliarcobacter butzleri]MDN5084246.1 glycosyltransferase family 4 protein [Aliarcobacter butzleri]